MKFSVFVTPTIQRADGSLVEYPRQKNMITDQGLSKLFGGTSYQTVLDYFHIGISDEANYRDTVADTLSCSISTLTAAVPTFVQADADNKRVIQFADNTKARIVTFNSDTEVLIDQEYTFSNVSGRIWDVECIKLKDHLKVSNTYTSPVAGDDYGTSYTFEYGGVDNSYYRSLDWKTRRFDFIDTGAVIREIGWSDSSSSTTALCGRLVLDSPIIVSEAEMLFVKIELECLIQAGMISSDPIFGQEASIHIPLEWNGYAMQFNADNGQSPFIRGVSTFVCGVTHDNGTTYKSGGVSVSTTKPYKKTFAQLTWLDLDMPNITQYGMSGTADKMAQQFVLDQNNLPSVSTTQLLRLTPSIEVERELPAFPGTTLPVPPIYPNEPDTWDGSVPCLGGMSRIASNYSSYWFGAAYHSDGLYYITDRNGAYADLYYAQIRVYDAATLTLSTSIQLGKYYDPREIAVDDNYIYVEKGTSYVNAAYQFDILVYNRSTGASVGTIESDGIGNTSIVNIGGQVYRIQTDGTTEILDGATVSASTLQLPYDSYRIAHMFADYIVLVASNNVYGIDRTTGDVVWKTRLPASTIGGRFDFDNDRIILFTSSSDNRVLAMDIVNWND